MHHPSLDVPPLDPRFLRRSVDPCPANFPIFCDVAIFKYYSSSTDSMAPSCRVVDASAPRAPAIVRRRDRSSPSIMLSAASRCRFLLVDASASFRRAMAACDGRTANPGTSSVAPSAKTTQNLSAASITASTTADFHFWERLSTASHSLPGSRSPRSWPRYGRRSFAITCSSPRTASPTRNTR